MQIKRLQLKMTLDNLLLLVYQRGQHDREGTGEDMLVTPSDYLRGWELKRYLALDDLALEAAQANPDAYPNIYTEWHRLLRNVYMSGFSGMAWMELEIVRDEPISLVPDVDFVYRGMYGVCGRSGR